MNIVAMLWWTCAFGFMVTGGLGINLLQTSYKDSTTIAVFWVSLALTFFSGLLAVGLSK